jgi:hypothetical protein
MIVYIVGSTYTIRVCRVFALFIFILPPYTDSSNRDHYDDGKTLLLLLLHAHYILLASFAPRLHTHNTHIILLRIYTYIIHISVAYIIIYKIIVQILKVLFFVLVWTPRYIIVIICILYY